MPGVAAFLLSHWRAVAALVIVLALAGYIETLRLERDHAYSKEAKAKAELATFKAEVKVLGEQAKAEALAKEAADKKRKEAADEEHTAALADLAGKLRDARRRPVSTPAPCPSSPAGADRYRAEFDGAYRDLVAGLRAEGERCSKAVIDLNTPKRWARGSP